MAVHDNPPHQPFPDYTQMVIGAIEAMSGKGGATKDAIADYIVVNYTDLPQAHVTHVAHTLEKLTQTGQLMVLKDGGYTINPSRAHHTTNDDDEDDDDEDDDEEEDDHGGPTHNGVGLSQPIKRGRGRPPKPKSDSPASAVQVGLVQSSPRPRGRPPKPRDPLAPIKPTKPPSSGRPRGRPRKSPQVGVGSGSGPVPGPAAVVGGVKRGRGRPRKS